MEKIVRPLSGCVRSVEYFLKDATTKFTHELLGSVTIEALETVC